MFDIYGESNLLFEYLIRGTILITIILFILTKLLTNRRIIYKKTIKSTKVLLDPIFAESLIDGKIGAKELIMSCLMDLVYRKNIEIIDNNIIRINNLDNTSEYERKVLELIFIKRKETSFDNLERMFEQNLIKTRAFYENLEIIKEKIKQYFIEEKIYSRIGEIILTVIRTLSLILILNFITLTLILSETISYEVTVVLITFFSVVGVIISNLKIKKEIPIKNVWDEEKQVNWYMISCCASIFFCSYLVIIVQVLEINIIGAMLILLTFIINIITFNGTKKHCLTNKGIIEYNKVYGLKKYIKEYSLMEQREMDGVQVWDRYLAYACAFGISAKITGKIDERAMKLNIFFQTLKNYE